MVTVPLQESVHRFARCWRDSLAPYPARSDRERLLKLRIGTGWFNVRLCFGWGSGEPLMSINHYSHPAPDSPWSTRFRSVMHGYPTDSASVAEWLLMQLEHAMRTYRCDSEQAVVEQFHRLSGSLERELAARIALHDRFMSDTAFVERLQRYSTLAALELTHLSVPQHLHPFPHAQHLYFATAYALNRWCMRPRQPMPYRIVYEPEDDYLFYDRDGIRVYEVYNELVVDQRFSRRKGETLIRVLYKPMWRDSLRNSEYLSESASCLDRALFYRYDIIVDVVESIVDNS